LSELANSLKSMNSLEKLTLKFERYCYGLANEALTSLEVLKGLPCFREIQIFFNHFTIKDSDLQKLAQIIQGTLSLKKVTFHFNAPCEKCQCSLKGISALLKALELFKSSLELIDFHWNMSGKFTNDLLQKLAKGIQTDWTSLKIISLSFEG